MDDIEGFNSNSNDWDANEAREDDEDMNKLYLFTPTIGILIIISIQ